MDIQKYAYLFDPYDQLVKEADFAFQKIRNKYPECVKCKLYCCDCCYAVFGLFLIEALFLKYDFEQLPSDIKEKALKRAKEADAKLSKLQKRLEEFKDDPHMINYVLSRERIRCPLLSEDNKCILYPYRPITCRVYGIPVLIRGNVKVCYKSGFKKGEVYTTYNMDKAYRELFSLSKELVKAAGQKDESRASLLISVAKAISTPIDKIAKGDVFEDSDKDS